MSKGKKTKRKMSKKQRKAIGPWLREAADMIGLRDTTILVLHDPSEKGAWAQCWPTWGQRQVGIAVDARIFTRSDAEIARVLVHELIHAHHSDLKLDLYAATDSLPEVHEEWIMQVVTRNIELLVDNLARVLVDHMDLPSVEGLRA